LSKVYHWSPTKNRISICKEGLTVFNSSIEYENPLTGKQEVWRCPYICTSLEPLTAYNYVIPMFNGGAELDAELPSLDLYEIDLLETDRVMIRNDSTIRIIEVRVLNSIPADRVHYIATRDKEY
jgi:hypothetical protein